MDTFFIERVAAYNPNKPADDGALVILNCPASVLEAFRKLLTGTRILGASYLNPYTQKTETIPKNAADLTASHLQILARNEQVNVTGTMKTKLYRGLLTDDQVARLRCLVKATTVVGVVYATHTGGYRQPRKAFDTAQKNILIDQSGLQWQYDYRNTGGMHFYPKDVKNKELPEGYQAWQNEMYQVMYGVKRPAKCSKNGLEVSWNGVPGKLDLDSVTRAIAVEFSQALDAAVYQGELQLADSDRINFKFCRAGMGFFLSGLACESEFVKVARLKGIELVLKEIASLEPQARAEKLGKIGRIVLPHSNEAPYSDEVLSSIGKLVTSLGLEWGGAPEEDAFRPINGYVNATTNCADPHAMPGNEGGPCSVDACIAYNANINNHNAAFNPNLQVRSAPEFVVEPANDLSFKSIFSTKRSSGSEESSNYTSGASSLTGKK